MELASYIFKPKHSQEIAMKVVERFCNDFLHYEHEGFYLNWRTSKQIEASGTGKYRPLPDGFIEVNIECDGGHCNMEAWTEACWDERRLEASDLTDSFFAILPEDFWYTGEDGKPDYHFYERELAEIVGSLTADDSRVVSFGCGRQAWVRGTKAENGSYSMIDLLDYTLTVPIVNRKPEGEQLQLTF